MFRSDDYVGATIAGINFYYGYEYTYCKKHGIQLQTLCDCADSEWLAVAMTNDNVLLAMTADEIEKEKEVVIDEPPDYLLTFIELFFDRGNELTQKYAKK